MNVGSKSGIRFWRLSDSNWRVKQTRQIDHFYQYKEEGGGWPSSFSMETAMQCDIDFRYRRALQPDGLITFDACFSAVQDAIEDARFAGIDPGKDPAVQLLSIRLAAIGESKLPDDTDFTQRRLRTLCIERLTDLKTSPLLFLWRCGESIIATRILLITAGRASEPCDR